MMHTITSTNETDSTESKFHDYIVEQTPLHADGRLTRFLGNVRKDTGECLGVCTDRYDLVQNADLIGLSEEMFTARGLTGWERKEVVSHGGAKARFIYKFPKVGFSVGRNDNLIFALKVQNSFDGSLRASFNIGLFRLICSNGLTIPHKAINLSHKHTGTLNAEMLSRGLDQAISQFHQTAPMFEAMSKVVVDQKFGEAVIDSLVKRSIGGLTDRQAEGIRALWQNPTHHEDRERTLWSLHNAVTQHLTHNVENGVKPRFELAERLSTGITAEFARAVRNPNLAHALLTAAA
jgi:hypothetical protein